MVSEGDTPSANGCAYTDTILTYVSIDTYIYTTDAYTHTPQERILEPNETSFSKLDLIGLSHNPKLQ